MSVIVVGAGIAGLTTAWSLVKRGHAVTLVEQGPIPNPLSASGDQHRLMRRACGTAAGYSRLINEALDAWDELWADLGRSFYANRGVIAINQFPSDGGTAFVTSLDRGGHAFDSFTPQEAAERWAYLDPATFRAAYYSKDGGALLCQMIGNGIGTWLRQNGAELRDNTTVAAIDETEGRITLVTGEVLTADHVVVAAGAWTLKLMPDLADTLTICRQGVVYLEPPAHLKAVWADSPAVQNVGGTIGGYILPPIEGTGLKFAAGAYKRLAHDPFANRTLPWRGRASARPVQRPNRQCRRLPDRQGLHLRVHLHRGQHILQPGPRSHRDGLGVFRAWLQIRCFGRASGGGSDQ